MHYSFLPNCTSLKIRQSLIFWRYCRYSPLSPSRVRAGWPRRCFPLFFALAPPLTYLTPFAVWENSPLRVRSLPRVTSTPRHLSEKPPGGWPPGRAKLTDDFPLCFLVEYARCPGARSTADRWARRTIYSQIRVSPNIFSLSVM